MTLHTAPSGEHIRRVVLAASRAGATTAPPSPRRARPRPSRLRPDVQALRAVAVAAVVLYHLWPRVVRGGYVGVDVFFVISGCLITGQLVGDVERHGQIRLGEFWRRRIRRILPASLLVLAASVALLVFGMGRVVWSTNLADIRAAAAYVENWQLGARAVDYLAAGDSPSLVQHYWSLSVEEQFYVAWPLLLLTASFVGARVAGGRWRRRIVAATLGTATVASFAAAVVWTRRAPSYAFFATPTRVWEFGAGALAALALPRVRRRLGAGTSLLAAAGFVAVGTATLVLTATAGVPGVAALLPVAGAALVMVAEPDEAGRFARALRAARPVQWLGDNSYAVYLWHWPLLVAAPWIVGHDLTFADRCAIAGASCALAALTKVTVEDPVRFGAWWGRRRTAPYALAAGGVAALVVVTSGMTTSLAHHERTARVAAHVAAARAATTTTRSHARSCVGAAAMDPANTCANPFARPADLDPAVAADDGRGAPCLQPVEAVTPSWCVLGDTQHPVRTLAVFGNSHAWRLVPALSLVARSRHWKILVAARVDCLGLTTRPIGNGGASASCLQWSAALQHDLLTMPSLDAAVVASYRYTDRFTDGSHPTLEAQHDRDAQILDLWTRLRARGTRVLVVQDVPGTRPTPAPECIAQSAAHVDPCPRPRAQVDVPNVSTTLADEHPELATQISLDRWLCDATTCHALIGGVVVYFDDHHLTTTFAESLAPYLGGELDTALARHRDTRDG